MGWSLNCWLFCGRSRIGMPCIPLNLLASILPSQWCISAKATATDTPHVPLQHTIKIKCTHIIIIISTKQSNNWNMWKAWTRTSQVGNKHINRGKEKHYINGFHYSYIWLSPTLERKKEHIYDIPFLIGTSIWSATNGEHPLHYYNSPSVRGRVALQADEVLTELGCRFYNLPTRALDDHRQHLLNADRKNN